MPVCPQCGQENPEGFKFCGNCAAPLAEPTAVEAEERKLVSVLFVDLVGHTAASDQADPEDVRARLRPYHELLKHEIERYGGTVEKFVGDAVMAVFGAPVSHEDDAERAVRSAFRILEAVEELELEVRAAVATGEAVVSLAARPERGEGIVAGDVVNTASRLQQEAPAGGLVVGEVTYRSTRDAIEYEPLEPVTLKGKAEPVLLWRAIGARARFGIDTEAARTPFVGREHDLALLQNAYERALREEAIQLVTVTGEPGVGKTRLVAELRSWLDARPERVRWRQGRSLPYGEGITYWALGEIVKAQAGILESDGSDEAAEKLETAVGALVEEGSDREWLTARLAPLVGTATASDGAVEREEAFAAWRRFLETLAAQRPLVLVLEDLHWADAPLLEFLDHLVDWASGVPMLVVCTARPELYERHPGWGGGKRNSSTLALSPLTGEETARLVSALLERAVLPASTQAALLERAGGNPLYAEEFVRMLADRGILTAEGELASDGEIAVPESVQALIAARLDTLPPDRKALLHDAAVVGKVFWPGSVADIGGVERATVEQGLRELVRKELVRPARSSSVEGEDEFAFWHLLVRDVAYGQIPRAARAQKHRAAADWIEEIAGERVADHAELLAEHYRQALELVRAAGSGEPTEELEAKAAHFLTLAGDRAFNLDIVKAERYYAEALELAPQGTRERAELLQSHALAAHTAPGVESVGQAREAVEAFRELQDDRGVAGALAHLSRVLWNTGQTKEGQDVLMEALALLEGEPPSAELCAVYSNLSGQAMTAGRARESLAWAEKGLPLARSLGLVPQENRLIQFIGSSRCMLGDLGGLDDLREAVRLGLESGIGPETALGYTNLAGFTHDSAGPEAALAVYSEGIDFAERRGLVGFARWAGGERVWPLFDLGRWDEIVEITEDYSGEAQIAVLARTYRAYVVGARGSAGQAATIMETLLPRAREIADAQILIPALAVGAVIDRLQGKLQGAVDLVEELVRESVGRLAFRAAVASEAARVCLAASGQETLSRLLEGLDDPGLTRWVLSVESARAVLAELEGRLDEAQELQLALVRRWEEYGSVYERAHAHLGRARCLVALGRKAEAADDLQEAREIFNRLGALPLLAEADALVSRAATG